jgi:hypothetical protein
LSSVLDVPKAVTVYCNYEDIDVSYPYDAAAGTPWFTLSECGNDKPARDSSRRPSPEALLAYSKSKRVEEQEGGGVEEEGWAKAREGFLLTKPPAPGLGRSFV